MKSPAVFTGAFRKNMLEANKSVIFEKIFAVYNRNLLKRHFHSFQVSGLDFLLNKNPRIPFVIYCNHSSWWDGLVAFQICRRAGLNSFVMMEEKHLKRLYLFRRLGAFSVVREKPREAFKSIKYAAGLLKEQPNAVLWIFPQGKILPNDRRPIEIYNGVGKIIQKTGDCAAISLAMRYEFLGDFKPHIFVKIKKPELIAVKEDFNAKQLSENFAVKLTKNLDSLKSDVVNQNLADYKSIF